MKRLLHRLRQIGKERAAPPRLPLSDLAMKLRAERPDLQAAFDLDRKDQHHALSQWLIFHGFSEIGVPADRATLEAYRPWLAAVPHLPCFGPLPLTWLMHEAALRQGFSAEDLRASEAQQRIVRWFFLTAIAKYNWFSLLTKDQADALLSVEAGSDIPLIVQWIWDEDQQLSRRFSSPADSGFRSWLRERGGVRWPLLAHPHIGLADGLRPPPNPDLPFGVNLVGHPRGRFGIGEDVRMAASALAAGGVPFTVCDVSGTSPVGHEDRSLDHFVSEDLPYRYTVFCATGLDTVRIVNLLGRQAFDGQVLIGFWPWELPEFPEMFQHAYALVDEVWASTHYTRDAYLRSSPVPVRHMPMVVTYDETNALTRKDFGLPDDRFLFVFAYDALSSSARKNPNACLEAFDSAFPRGDEPVGIVIKGIRAKDSQAWMALEARAAQDPRLFLIDKSLERGALLDLYRACDCFLSLHRAEGFGRNIAECMALGLPVIVTAHSGNLDFTQWDTAALVPARLRPVLAGEYPFGTGQIWAEPDVAAAGALMHRMAQDRPWREGLAKAGSRRIRTLYSPEAVGQRWREMLDLLDSRNADMAAVSGQIAVNSPTEPAESWRSASLA